MITAKIKYYTPEKKQETKTVELPQSWDEVNWGQFVGIFKASSHLGSEAAKVYKFLEVLTGLSADQWAASDPEMSLPIFAHLNFLQEQPVFVKPEFVEYNGKEFQLPELRNETLDQVTTIQTLAAKSIEAAQEKGDDLETIAWNCLYDVFAQGLAIVFQPHFDGTFPATDAGRIAKITEEIEGWPCTEVGALGTFFLKKPLGLKLSGARRWRGRTNRRKKGLMSGRWRSLGRLTRSMRSRLATSPN